MQHELTFIVLGYWVSFNCEDIGRSELNLWQVHDALGNTMEDMKRIVTPNQTEVVVHDLLQFESFA